MVGRLSDIKRGHFYVAKSQPPNFQVTLLGTKLVLAIMHGDTRHWYGGDLPGGETLFDREGLPGWPSPAVGRWELRQVYVLDVVPLPVISDYCYGHKVIFVDKETFVQLYLDDYDSGGNLYNPISRDQSEAMPNDE